MTANQISVLSVVFAALGGGLVYRADGWIALVVAALCVQLRLLCNLLDGMVAIEGRKATPAGALYNEVPDRIADTVLLVAAGYAAGWPFLGWACALLAALTAYVRVLGGALGLVQDFGGVMAKQRRMAALTAGLLAAAAEAALQGTHFSLVAALSVIAVGGLVTCATRVAGIARRLAAT